MPDETQVMPSKIPALKSTGYKQQLACGLVSGLPCPVAAKGQETDELYGMGPFPEAEAAECIVVLLN
jgi:hypothetical protein